MFRFCSIESYLQRRRKAKIDNNETKKEQGYGGDRAPATNLRKLCVILMMRHTGILSSQWISQRKKKKMLAARGHSKS